MHTWVDITAVKHLVAIPDGLCFPRGLPRGDLGEDLPGNHSLL